MLYNGDPEAGLTTRAKLLEEEDDDNSASLSVSSWQSGRDDNDKRQTHQLAKTPPRAKALTTNTTARPSLGALTTSSASLAIVGGTDTSPSVSLQT